MDAGSSMIPYTFTFLHSIHFDITALLVFFNLLHFIFKLLSQSCQGSMSVRYWPLTPLLDKLQQNKKLVKPL